MHVLQGSLVGLCLWAASLAASPSLSTIVLGPLIVSGTALVLALLPV